MVLPLKMQILCLYIFWNKNFHYFRGNRWYFIGCYKNQSKRLIASVLIIFSVFCETRDGSQCCLVGNMVIHIRFPSAGNDRKSADVPLTSLDHLTAFVLSLNSILLFFFSSYFLALFSMRMFTSADDIIYSYKYL